MDLHCFSFKASDPSNSDCAIVSSLSALRGARKRSKVRPGTDARIFFHDSKTRYFVNPLWLSDVRAAIKNSSYGGRVRPSIHPLTCTVTWKFSGAEDPELRRFDDFYQDKEVRFMQIDLSKPVRVLLPYRVRDFLKGHDFDEKELEDYTLNFQHYPKQEAGKRDCHDFFAARLLESMKALADAEANSEQQKIIKHASQLQLTLATRLGFSHVLAGLGKEEDDADAMNPETVADFESMLMNFEQQDEASFRQLHEVQGKKGKPMALLDDLRKLCSEQVSLKNPFGNIIINSGKSTILGGRLPVLTIGYEAARLLGFWDHEVRSPPEGDLHNEELLDMVRNGPCRDGGAWTLHLCFNEAVHIPERRREDMGSAKNWLCETLARHLAADLSKKFAAARPSHQRGTELFKICKGFLQGGSFEALLEKEASPIAQWLRDFPHAQPKSRCLVTAVQRHARTLDLNVAVRHPITQPVPHYLLMVDKTKTGFALGMPPQFGNLSELDYDGDKMKIAAERAARRRALLEQCLSVPKLMHSALGKRVVKLSGVAPLALTLAQQNGAAGLDLLSLRPRREDSVLWPGVRETVYDPSYFFDELCSVGLAVPELLARRWSSPCFEEVRFRVLKKDGAWIRSRHTAVSHDGFYPVPADWTAGNKLAWIAADLQRHRDRFAELQQPFVLELEPGGRASALDGLTFAQMRSLTQTFTPQNFSSDDVTVPHAPGLVVHGSFSSFSVPRQNPWQRMAKVLLKLAQPPTCFLGHDAVVSEMFRCTWRPSESDVARCILAKDYELKAVGGLGLPQLPQAVQDRAGIADLALHHRGLEAKGCLEQSQMLRRFAFEPPSWQRGELRSGRPLDLSEAKAVWEALNLSELRRLRAEPLSAERLEPLDESGWKRRLVVEEGPMSEGDWNRLAAVAHEVGCLRRRRLPVLKAATLVEEGLASDYLSASASAEDPLQYVRDWCRFVGAVQAPQRQVMDVEASIEMLASLCNDDYDYCMTLSALEALGHLLANLLNQPTQNEVVTEEDAYCTAANLGLEDAKRKLYALEENGSEDFSEVRQKVLEVLRAVSLALSNGQHSGNLHLVRAAAGLLAVDWSLEQDTVRLHGVRFEAVRCDKLEEVRPRFSCWQVAWEGEALVPSSHPLMYSVCLSRQCLLQFDFPATKEEALRLSGLVGLASPVKPSRWQRLCRAALAKGAAEGGEPSPDFNRELFDWDYRLYRSADGRVLVPLMEDKKRTEGHCAHPGCRRPACFASSKAAKEAEPRFCRGHRTERMVEVLDEAERFWCLLDEAFEVTPLFAAKPGVPPSEDRCTPGPDGRLPRALALLNDSPEKLQLNRLAHRKVGEALMQSGTPFLVGNMSAPRSNDKRAAATILRMPVFGAKFGVRSRTDQPLGGEEVSAACIGSARNSAMSILENECRRARQNGGNQKEVTALWNKRATIKAGLALLKRCGRIYGPPIYDRLCRHVREGSKYPCMGLLSKKLECRTCKKVYAGGDGTGRDMRQLVRRKRLLEDPGCLLVSKKMRLKQFAPENHSVLRGKRCLNILEALKETEEDGEAETLLPEDCRLSRDRAGALAYPCEVVYYLGRRGRLQPCRAEQQAARGGLPDLDPSAERPDFFLVLPCFRCPVIASKSSFPFFRWMLPRGHYVLVEKYRVPRGEEHSLEVVLDVPWEEEEWKRHQERLKMVKAALQPRAPVEQEESEQEEVEDDAVATSEEEEVPRQDLVPVARMVGPLDTAMREQETALGDFRDYVAAAKLPEHVPEFEDCHDRQLDCPLVDLDFVVELMEGKAFRGLPDLERYGSADPTPCLCGAPSVVSLLKNASEAESCIVARRSFQGSLSTLCPQCLQAKREASERATAALRELLSEEERDVVVLLRFRDEEAEGRLRAYRVFHWMLARGVDVRVEHFDELPRFVLRDIFQLKLLEDALDKEAKGTLVHARRGVCVPHFTDPLDEALSTMQGKRTFMQTLEAQKFSSIKGMKKELLACFRERNSMQIMDGVDEALVGSTSMDRWQDEVVDSERGPKRRR